ARPDDGAMPDLHARQDDGEGSDPHVRSYDDIAPAADLIAPSRPLQRVGADPIRAMIAAQHDFYPGRDGAEMADDQAAWSATDAENLRSSVGVIPDVKPALGHIARKMPPRGVLLRNAHLANEVGQPRHADQRSAASRDRSTAWRAESRAV